MGRPPQWFLPLQPLLALLLLSSYVFPASPPTVLFPTSLPPQADGVKTFQSTTVRTFQAEGRGARARPRPSCRLPAPQGSPAAAPLPPVLEVRRLRSRPPQPRRRRPRWAEPAAD